MTTIKKPMRIVMDNAQILVTQEQAGVRIIQITDRASGIVVVIPLLPEAARSIGAALTSSLVIASGPLPTGADGQALKH